MNKISLFRCGKPLFKSLFTVDGPYALGTFTGYWYIHTQASRFCSRLDFQMHFVLNEFKRFGAVLRFLFLYSPA